jgi:hypothetical protein
MTVFLVTTAIIVVVWASAVVAYAIHKRRRHSAEKPKRKRIPVEQAWDMLGMTREDLQRDYEIRLRDLSFKYQREVEQLQTEHHDRLREWVMWHATPLMIEKSED